jgi:hypothetical protein
VKAGALGSASLMPSWRSTTVSPKRELDFIINYDIKYRMGLSGGSVEEEG